MSQKETWVSGGDFKFDSPLKGKRLELGGGNIRSPIVTRRRTTLALGRHVGPLLAPGDVEKSPVTKTISSATFYKKTTSGKSTKMAKSLATTEQTSMKRGVALESARQHPSMVKAVPANKRGRKSVAVIEESPLEIQTKKTVAKKSASSEKAPSITSQVTRAAPKATVAARQTKGNTQGADIKNASSLKSTSPKTRLRSRRGAKSSLSGIMEISMSPAKNNPLPKTKPPLSKSTPSPVKSKSPVRGTSKDFSKKKKPCPPSNSKLVSSTKLQKEASKSPVAPTYPVKASPSSKNSLTSKRDEWKLSTKKISTQKKRSQDVSRTPAVLTSHSPQSNSVSPVKDMSEYIKEIVQEKSAMNGSGEACHLTKTDQVTSQKASASVRGTAKSKVVAMPSTPTVPATACTPKLQSKLATPKLAKKKASRSSLKLPTPKSIKKASTPTSAVKSAAPKSAKKPTTPVPKSDAMSATELNSVEKLTKSVGRRSMGLSKSPARHSTVDPVEISDLVAKTLQETRVTSSRRKSEPRLAKGINEEFVTSTRKRAAIGNYVSPKRPKQTPQVVRKATPNRVTRRSEKLVVDTSLPYHTPNVKPLAQKAGQTPFLTPDVSSSSLHLNETIKSVDSSLDVSQTEEKLTSSHTSSSWCSIM